MIVEGERNSKLSNLFVDRCPKIMEFLSEKERNQIYSKKEKPKKNERSVFLPNILHDFLIYMRTYSNKNPIKFWPTMGMESFPFANFYEYLTCMGETGINYWRARVYQ